MNARLFSVGMLTIAAIISAIGIYVRADTHIEASALAERFENELVHEAHGVQMFGCKAESWGSSRTKKKSYVGKVSLTNTNRHDVDVRVFSKLSRKTQESKAHTIEPGATLRISPEHSVKVEESFFYAPHCSQLANKNV